MASRFSQLLVSAMLLAGLVSAQVGTMPFLNCGANVVKTVGVTCETYTQPALKTPCVCSTLSLHYSCYTSLCPPDNLNDVYESMLNSMNQQKNGAGAGLRVGAAADALVSAGGLVGFAVAVLGVLA
ncbi:hypothetical protein GGTG_11811 [Gaeumannomyces tritici R3-111a-1]|uniref:Extracellular membrane protein CFEM domain-containing protein n=1 Tax=Gaeumannomyces tritici (strain R3-111a-1) TaxID=644352 RepID=J3PE88_GAET3|nr:hypothetical protein GGTG_11811 [Gaeumannomyces tritici R3-111a-1]EJT70788.1 hypothetical protein GGTG_11811 [Gaeumannomyces tritici R3-111a-1]